MAFISPFRGVRLKDVKTDKNKVEESSNGIFVSKNFPNLPKFFDIAHYKNGKEEEISKSLDVSTTFNSLVEKEFFIQDQLYSLYLYETISHLSSGKSVSKMSLICLVRIEDVEKSIIKPHKETSQQITSEIASSLQNSKAQFTPVSALFSDKANLVFNLLQTEQKTHLYSVEDHEGCKHQLWKIDQPETINSIQHFFDTKELYIIEEHETYNAAVNNKTFSQETDNNFSSKHPANHVMFSLSKLEDKDLTILPAHVLVQLPTLVSSKNLIASLQKKFKISYFNQGSRERIIFQLLNWMDELDKSDTKKKNSYIGLYHPTEDCGLLIESIEDSSESKLDFDTLTHEILPTISKNHETILELDDHVQYFTDPDEALDICVKKSITSTSETPLLFLMNPTRIEQVLQYADNKQLMPYHATCFYPRAHTGPIIHNHENGLIIEDIFMEPVGK